MPLAPGSTLTIGITLKKSGSPVTELPSGYAPVVSSSDPTNAPVSTVYTPAPSIPSALQAVVNAPAGYVPPSGASVTFTAKNSDGTATDTLVVPWEPAPIPEPDEIDMVVLS
jgi:hypothetical protein